MGGTFAFVENDRKESLTLELGRDITGWSIELQIPYDPHPLFLPATITNALAGSASVAWASRVETTLAEAVAAGASTLKINAAEFAALPASGEILIDTGEAREWLRYASKTGPDVLNLTDKPAAAHAAGVAVEKLPDLRAGKWPVHIQATDAAGLPQTFTGLTLDIAAEIRPR